MAFSDSNLSHVNSLEGLESSRIRVQMTDNELCVRANRLINAVHAMDTCTT